MFVDLFVAPMEARFPFLGKAEWAGRRAPMPPSNTPFVIGRASEPLTSNQKVCLETSEKSAWRPPRGCLVIAGKIIAIGKNAGRGILRPSTFRLKKLMIDEAALESQGAA